MSHATVFALWKLMFAPQTEGYDWKEYGNDFVAALHNHSACLETTYSPYSTRNSWLHGGNVRNGAPTMNIHIKCGTCAVMYDQALEYRASIESLALNDEQKVKLAIKQVLSKYMGEPRTSEIETLIKWDIEQMFQKGHKSLAPELSELFRKFECTVEFEQNKPILIKMRHKIKAIDIMEIKNA